MSASESRFTRVFQAGEVIFREGDEGHTMFVVRAGQVRITKHVRGGERTYATLGPGEFFGEMAVLSGRPRTATAVAIGELTLLELDEKRFDNMISTQAEIAARILKKLARRLETADSLIAILTKRDPKTRVILGLIREAEERGVASSNDERRVIRRNPEGFAEELGVKVEELEEVLARLTRLDIAKPREDGSIELAGIGRLTEFLGFLESRGVVRD